MSFDTLAARYALIETLTFGGALQRARTRWLREVPAPQNVLIIGEGNGRFLEELLSVYPGAAIDCLDASANMLELARLRICRDSARDSSRVRFIRKDVLNWIPNNSYDLIVTHFLLDCFPYDELKVIVGKLAGAARPGAAWLLADFALPESGWARIHARVWLEAMYLFFRMTTDIRARRLLDPADLLSKCEFRRTAVARWRAGLLKSEIWLRS